MTQSTPVPPAGPPETRLQPESTESEAGVDRAHVAIAATAYLVAPVLGLDGFSVDPRISEVWPLGGVGFVLLTTVWPAPLRWRAATLVAMASLVVLTGVALGWELGEVAWVGVVAALQPLLMAWTYRRLRGGTRWSPRQPVDVLWLLLATLASTSAVAVVGGYPHPDVPDLSAVVLLWWVVRSSVFCFVGGLLFVILFDPRLRDRLGPGPWWSRVALVPVSVGCVLAVYHDPMLPLSWLLLVPSVWAGLSLTVRGTAWVSLFVALLAASMSLVPRLQFGYSGPLPAATIVDVLVMASTALAVVLALIRGQRTQLLQDLTRSVRDAERQSELLGVVLDTTSEGVVVLDGSTVTTSNAASRQLLGAPLPAQPGLSWASRYALTDTDGRPISDRDLVAMLRRGSTDPVELRVGGARSLEVTVKQLRHRLDEAAQRDQRVVLLRDVTDQRRRMRELTEFAGLVAHDLRGPLTVLDGWLDIATDEATDAAEQGDATTRALLASRRMRQVIDDWLGYMVVQEGQVRPVPVALHDAATPLARAREAHADDLNGAEISLALPHVVRADPALLRQVLDNLVDNAVKYTRPDRRPVVALSSHDDLEPGWVRIEVRDRGMGIPEGQEEQIFAEFHRGPEEGRSAGTGLGLSLTRRIVAMHGGQLTARRNESGDGSTFAFTLPAA